MQNFNYTLSDLDHMLPWEREVYITMLVQHLEEQRQQNGNA